MCLPHDRSITSLDTDIMVNGSSGLKDGVMHEHQVLDESHGLMARPPQRNLAMSAMHSEIP
jgi:hypothetical protein